MRTPHVYLPLVGLLVLASLFTAGRSLSAPRSRPELSEVAGARYRLDPASAKISGARLLAQDVRRDGFHFAPTVAPADRQAFLDAVAASRARRPAASSGWSTGSSTSASGPARDAGRHRPDRGRRARLPGDPSTSASSWQRGTARVAVKRTVLHELGARDRRRAADRRRHRRAGRRHPAGLGLRGRASWAAAPAGEERFAESFAKWATGRHRGRRRSIGYAVPPPVALARRRGARRSRASPCPADTPTRSPTHAVGDALGFPKVGTRIKTKKRCCKSRPRCKRCPVVCKRLEALERTTPSARTSAPGTWSSIAPQEGSSRPPCA